MSSAAAAAAAAFHPLLLHAAVSAAAALLAASLDLSSRLLHGLHTYIHPDSLAPSDGLRAAIRPPSSSAAAEPKRRPRSRSDPFDESKAQLLRLRLGAAHLRSRPFFPLYRLAFLSSAVALSNLVLRSSSALPALVATLSAALLFFALAKLSLERSASRSSEKQLSLLSGCVGFLVVLSLSPSIFDFRLGSAAAVFAGCLAALLFAPAAKAARAFYVGTDQLRWNLAVISCGPLARILLHVSLLSSIAAPLLWIDPVAAVLAGGAQWRVWALAAAATSQLLVLRANVQVYLNEAVLCWYQRLHASRVPDMDYGRAKVFLHNHYLCLTVLQFLAPPLLVLLLLGVSQMRGNLFESLVFIGSSVDRSDIVKEMSLFLAWWIMFVWSILTVLNLALYRCGILLIS